MKKRTVSNTNPKQAKASGVESIGSLGTWKVVQKAWNRKEGWMRSTKALEIPGAGCLIQVTTREGKQIAETACFVPDVKLEANPDGSHTLKATGLAATQITFTSGASGTPVSESRTVWYGTAGDELDRKIKAGEVTQTICRLNGFIQATWKITPTSKQLAALRALL